MLHWQEYIASVMPLIVIQILTEAADETAWLDRDGLKESLRSTSGFAAAKSFFRIDPARSLPQSISGHFLLQPFDCIRQPQ